MNRCIILALLFINCASFKVPISRHQFFKGAVLAATGYPLAIFKNEEDNSENTRTKSINLIDNAVYFCGELNEENCVKLTNTFIGADKAISKAQEEGQSAWMKLSNNSLSEIKMEIPDHIDFYIQSPGGSFLSTLALIDTLLNMKIPIHTYVHGYAASAATLLSVIGKKRYMYKHAVMLIHGVKLSNSNPTTVTEISDINQNVALFMKIMKEIYLEHTSLTEEKLDDLLLHDIYLSSREALIYNLIDEVI